MLPPGIFIPFFLLDSTAIKKKMQSVLSPFDFTAKKQADLQVMIDEWVMILTNEHVGFCRSFVILADEI